MADITKDSAKKELQSMVTDRKVEAKNEAESKMSVEERTAIQDQEKKNQEKQEQEATQATEKKKAEDELIAKPDPELDEEKLKEKNALIEQRTKDEESKLTNKEKIERVKEESQKRINAVIAEIKELRDQGSKEAQDLKKELQILQTDNENLTKKLETGSGKTPTFAEEAVKADKERIAKYLEEDAALPRDQRREMSDDDLQEWMEENPIGANRWIAEQTQRRIEERKIWKHNKQVEVEVKDFLDKQQASFTRTLIRHPDLDTKTRQAELEKEGKTKPEIHEILLGENQKYKLVHEIIASDREKYLKLENSPELIVEEMEKRLAHKPSTEPTDLEKRFEALEKKNEDLEAELATLKDDDEGIGGGHGGGGGDETVVATSEFEKEMEKTMKAAKATPAMIESAIKRHRAKKKRK